MPTYSRPIDGRNPTGSATERRGGLPGGGGGSGYFPGVYYDPYYYSSYGYYDPYFSSYRYGYSPYFMPGYGFGMGYFSYDPFLFGGYGYGAGAYGYDPYQGGYGSGGYGTSYRDVGSLRLRVKPTNAQVFIDGYFVGVVDSFDGAFQRLGVEAGAHKVEIRAEGYESAQFDVMVTPRETITYKGELKRK